MRGYYTQCGYIGIMPNGSKMLFATEADYIEYYADLTA